MATYMDVDSPAYVHNELAELDIYSEDDFPLVVRSAIDPVLKEMKLEDTCLDLDSSDPIVKARVDAICNEAFDKIIGCIRADNSFVRQHVTLFLRKFSDPRSFFIKLTQKLELEWGMTRKRGVVDHYLRMKKTKQEISDKILNIMKWWENMSKLADNICMRLDDCQHNYKAVKHNVVDENVREKVEQQRQETGRTVKNFRQSLQQFATDVNAVIATIPQAVSDYVEVVHRSLLEIRTHFRKELSHFLALGEAGFTSLKEDMEQIVNVIEQFRVKLSQIQVAFNFPSVDLQPLRMAIRILMERALVVAMEPPFSLRCLKTGKRHSYELRYLITKVSLKSTKVCAFLLNNEGLRMVKECFHRGQAFNSNMIEEQHQGGDFKCNCSPLENDPVNRVVKCSFKELTILHASRKHKHKEAVTEQKHVIFFTGEVVIDNQKVTVYCLSLPAIVSVHGSQTTKSLAAIFWDDNFREETRGSTLEVKSYVAWADVDNAIRGLFRRELMREPTAFNMQYLKRRLYAEHNPELGITFDMFAKSTSNAQKQRITFWDWLWGTIQLLSGDNHLLKLWQKGCIVGYIQQKEAQQILNTHRDHPEIPLGKQEAERLFLIRFSESQKELITVQGHLHDLRRGWGVFSVDPYKAQDLKSISLSQRILDRVDCQTLLCQNPTEQWIKIRKEDVLTPTANAEELPCLEDGYISWTLKERTDTAKFEDNESYRVEPLNDGRSTPGYDDALPPDWTAILGNDIDWNNIGDLSFVGSCSFDNN